MPPLPLLSLPPPPPLLLLLLLLGLEVVVAAMAVEPVEVAGASALLMAE
jgi:hypothetical protein